MQEAFPAYPGLCGVHTQRAFSLPQQNYLLARFLLEECREEAQRRLEADCPGDEQARMGRRAYAERLDGYREQLGYDELLTLYSEAKRQLIAWGIERLRRGAPSPAAQPILARVDLIWKRPRLQERFLEICMQMGGGERGHV